jgi:NADH dehydrogenase
MILIAGATGTLGEEIALRLLQNGEDVRVLVRHHLPSEAHFRQSSAEAVKTLIIAGAQPVYGDLKDRASLDAACLGVKQLLTTANSAARHGQDNSQSVDLQGNRNLIDAARQASVEHYIFVSALVGEPLRQHPFMMAKLETEAYLRASGLTYTILAPNAFMEGTIIRTIGSQALAGGPVALIGGGERVHSFIARSDVASFAIAALENPAAQDARLILGGPQPLSLRDVVGIYKQVLGLEIAIQTFKPGKQVPGLDELQTFVLTGYDEYESPVDMSELIRTFDLELTPLEVVLRESQAARI